MNPVVARMEEVRKRKGVTKTHIAKHCGHTVAWYHDIAKGRRKVYLDDAIMIAESLGEELPLFFAKKLSETRKSTNKTA